MELHFEKLVQDYLERLNVKLRLFASNAGPEFLEVWVHDENPSKSIYGIFEAAHEAQFKDELVVTVSQETQQTLNANWLQKELENLGILKIELRNDGSQAWIMRLDFSKPKPKAVNIALKKSPEVKPKSEQNAHGALAEDSVQSLKSAQNGQADSMHPIYQNALQAKLSLIQHEAKIMTANQNEILLQATISNVQLSCVVDGQGLVLNASHNKARGAHRVILDELCRAMIQCPLQEASDHGIIRVEKRLRGAKANFPVRGILTPNNADPAFQLPQKLIRDLYEQFLKQTQSKPAWNFWDERPKDSWLKNSKEEKINQVRVALSEAAQSLGIPQNIIEVVDVAGQVRVILGYNSETKNIAFGASMMALEKIIKEKLEGKLELHLENLEDRNRRDARTKRLDKT